MTPEEAKVIEAVLYAMREGLFFPVPEPSTRASTREWIQWGALRNLHTAVAALSREVR